MCGRYSLVKKSIPKEHRYAAKFAGIEPEPTYNAAPSQLLAVIPAATDIAQFFSWGLLPSWAKDAKMHRPINARAETLTTNGMFRNLLSRKRCLVPADGFYEWQVQTQPQTDMFGNPQASKGKPKKQPFRIALKNEELFSFAGLYDSWVDKSSGEEIKTFTIITTEANELVKPIHDRMPVILTPEAEELWLNEQEKDVKDLLKPYDADKMKAFPISNLINSPTNNSPEVLNSL
ncbi:SOS response-associated peptidase [Adhaeribacter rhizoryzae]|uniref:Abasic site processing protein n=1 Tax=Adhaeribacter rhizoryzae TaxID=2607907 RepID=A0A5M6DPM7_9BACT|nr:SOS response-associated peptidase [Adhaeribacter rhizoryzae]KAA5548356.1 SOS response-associated peptidase [Adhaeribacter rhizoryzae]